MSKSLTDIYVNNDNTNRIDNNITENSTHPLINANAEYIAQMVRWRTQDQKIPGQISTLGYINNLAHIQHRVL